MSNLIFAKSFFPLFELEIIKSAFLSFSKDPISLSHKEVFHLLREKGIGVNLHYIPVHLQPYYKALCFNAGDFPEAEKYYKEAISIPLFHTMSESEQLQVIKIIKEAL